jgi:mRNA-degrading endonuclease YafQ of YafQ-DinJ toxin-antitoxin module
MTIIYTASYNRKANKFFKKHPDLLPIYKETLLLIELNIFHPSLRLHKLKGNLSNLFSISINMSYRITISIIIRENAIIPIDIGSHEEVY